MEASTDWDEVGVETSAGRMAERPVLAARVRTIPAPALHTVLVGLLPFSILIQIIFLENTPFSLDPVGACPVSADTTQGWPCLPGSDCHPTPSQAFPGAPRLHGPTDTIQLDTGHFGLEAQPSLLHSCRP